MNTTRSDRIVERFRHRDFVAKRNVQEYERTFAASPAKLFPLLCPTREADWIPGWNSDLVYTSTGYAELDCVFTTGPENPFGAGTWVLNVVEPDTRFEFMKIGSDHLLQGRVTISPLAADRCLGRWTLTVTSLTPDANERVDSLPDQDPRFVALLDCLEHYLEVGHLGAGDVRD